MPAPTTITLAGESYPLTWDKAAIFRADELGVWTTRATVGFANAAKFVWAMGPDALRRKYPAPVDLANDLPPVAEVWQRVNDAQKGAGEDMASKNVFGSVNGPSPSSS